MQLVKKVSILLCAVILAACSTVAEPAVFPSLSFANLEPIAIGVSNVEVMDAPVLSRQPPNVEHLSPVSFEEAINAWANRRFAANGVGSTRLTVALNSGSLVENQLTTNRGLRGLLTNEQATEYEGRIHVTLRAIDRDGIVRGETSAEVWLTRTMAEDASHEERQMLLYEMVETLVQSLDDQIISEMRQHFGTYLL